MTASACPRCRGTVSNIQVLLNTCTSCITTTSPAQSAKFLERTFCAKCRFRFCYRKDAPQQCLDLHVCDAGVGSPLGRTTVEAILASAEKDRNRNAQRELRRRQRRQQSAVGALADADTMSQLIAPGNLHLLTPRAYGDQVGVVGFYVMHHDPHSRLQATAAWEALPPPTPRPRPWCPRPWSATPRPRWHPWRCRSPR